MSAASRSIPSANPAYRQFGAALAAVALAAVAVTAIALGQASTPAPATESAAGFASTLHDHGWAKAHAPGAATAGQAMDHDRGWSSTSSGPFAAPVTADPIGGSGGSVRGRLAQ